jgi:hypothetical protein
MVVPVVTGSRRDCGCDDTPPGDCPDGEECLPSDYIDPDDCPGEGAPCFEFLGSEYGANIDDATTDPLDTTGASLLVAFVTCPVSPDALTDSEGNTWASFDEDTPGSHFGFIYYAENPTTSATHTVNVTLPSESGVAVVLAAFAGPSISGVFDVGSGVNGSAFTEGNLRPGSITPSADHALVVTMTGGDDLTGPYVAGYQMFEEHGGVAFTASAIYAAFQVQNAATATNPDWTAPEVTDPETWGGAVLAVAFNTDVECDPSSACPDCEPVPECECCTTTPVVVEAPISNLEFGGTDVTVTFAEIPEDDDVIVITLYEFESNAAPVVTWPAGFEEMIPPTLVFETDTDSYIAAAWKRASGEASASYQVDYSGAAGANIAFGKSWRGVIATGTPFVGPTTPEGFAPGGSTLSTGDVTTVAPHSLWEVWKTDNGSNPFSVGAIRWHYGGGFFQDSLASFSRPVAAVGATGDMTIETLGTWGLGTAFGFALTPACSCDFCAYRPFCLSENADDPATVILALSPFAYYPMDDASGLIQDASGNGNHATAAQGTAAYSQPPITSKTGDSIRFDGDGFTIPKPDTTVGPESTWSFIWLQRVDAWQGTGSPAGGSCHFGVSQASNSDLLVINNTAGGDLYVIFTQDGAQNYASYFPEADTIGRVAVIALVCGGNAQEFLYVDGVRWGAAQGAGTGSGNDLRVGSLNDGFFAFPDVTISNLASFDRALTHAEIISITEALMDDAAFSTSYVPA